MNVYRQKASYLPSICEVNNRANKVAQINSNPKIAYRIQVTTTIVIDCQNFPYSNNIYYPIIFDNATAVAIKNCTTMKTVTDFVLNSLRDSISLIAACN